MAGESTAFDHTRTRFQRLYDARLFSGWIQSLTPSRVVVRELSEPGLQPGEVFHFEAHGIEETALFTARLEGTDGALFEFTLTSSLKRSPLVEDTRFKVRDVIAFCKRSDAKKEEEAAEPPAECAALDLSGSGMALLSTVPFPKGTWLEVTLITPFGPVPCKAEVRYCRHEARGHRLGLKILDMGRLERGRYCFFLQSLNS